MRVLIVDDSTLFRKVVRDALADISNLEIVGIATDGQMALDKIDTLNPDLVTLDLEMPIKDGIAVLEALQSRSERPEVLMLSGATEAGAAATHRALRLGAFDFVFKPTHSNLEQSREMLRNEFVPRIEAIAAARGKIRDAKSVSVVRSIQPTPAAEPCRELRAKVVGIGVSTGGPVALTTMLSRLPADLPVPILIVQHMPKGFTRTLADDLNRISKISVCEAVDGQRIEPGCAYLAPGGMQMKIVRTAGKDSICINDDPPEKNCRPSVDYLFRSLAHCYGPDAMAVVMTGMGDDGTLGCRLMKRNGSPIVVQDESSCVVYGMPRQVVAAGLADIAVPLVRLHETIIRAVTPGVVPCP